MPTKDELVRDAEALGIEDAEDKTKGELQDALDTRTPVELGPVIPEGETQPKPPKASGAPTKAVQPSTPDEIPEAGL